MKCHLLLFYTTTMNHFSIKLWPETKSEFYMTTGNNQLSGWTKEKLQSTSQSQTCTQKKKKKCHGHCLLVCFCSDPLQLSESRWNHYIWEVCSASQWSEVKWNEITQLCPTLCDPKDYSLLGSLSMGFSRQEYWSGLLFPSPEDLRNPGIEPGSSALQADSLLSEPLEKSQQINGMHQKLQCLPVLVNRRGPVLLQDNDRVHLTHTIFQKLNELVSVLPHLRYSAWPLANWLPLPQAQPFNDFCRENTSTTSRRQKMLSKSLWNPQTWIFTYRNKQMYFSLAEMCWLQWSYFE